MDSKIFQILEISREVINPEIIISEQKKSDDSDGEDTNNLDEIFKFENKTDINPYQVVPFFANKREDFFYKSYLNSATFFYVVSVGVSVGVIAGLEYVFQDGVFPISFP
jgi:hypothetical protein